MFTKVGEMKTTIKPWCIYYNASTGQKHASNNDTIINSLISSDAQSIYNTHRELFLKLV